MPQWDAACDQRTLEGEGAADDEGHEVVAPDLGDAGPLLRGTAMPVFAVARQVRADVQVGGQGRQARVAGLRHRQQGARLRVAAAVQLEVGGMGGRQDAHVALHVAVSPAGGVAVDLPGPDQPADRGGVGFWGFLALGADAGR